MLDDLNALERKLFQTYWDDGLLDLFAAAGVLLIGLAWWRGLPVLGAIVPALMAPLWGPLRERVVEPRLGMVEFSEARERSNRHWLYGILLSGVLVLILTLAVYFRQDGAVSLSVSRVIAALPAALLAFLATLVAVMLSCARFFVHALVLLIASIVGLILQWEPGSILLLAGGVMMLTALFTFLRFLGEYPVSRDGSE
jgi:hypothetical protein